MFRLVPRVRARVARARLALNCGEPRSKAQLFFVPLPDFPAGLNGPAGFKRSPAITVSVISVAAHAREKTFSDKIRHSNCVILRDSCKLLDLHFLL
ncbi:MAG: hypothetical protein DMF09_07405 [Verrucomicrobia bacterium]|nr:MAG: hypothetical protein DMF09_07405 [Verrucomicrobiota bacterium]